MVLSAVETIDWSRAARSSPVIKPNITVKICLCVIGAFSLVFSDMYFLIGKYLSVEFIELSSKF